MLLCIVWCHTVCKVYHTGILCGHCNSWSLYHTGTLCGHCCSLFCLLQLRNTVHYVVCFRQLVAWVVLHQSNLSNSCMFVNLAVKAFVLMTVLWACVLLFTSDCFLKSTENSFVFLSSLWGSDSFLSYPQALINYAAKNLHFEISQFFVLGRQLSSFNAVVVMMKVQSWKRSLQVSNLLTLDCKWDYVTGNKRWGGVFLRNGLRVYQIWNRVDCQRSEKISQNTQKIKKNAF